MALPSKPAGLSLYDDLAMKALVASGVSPKNRRGQKRPCPGTGLRDPESV